MFSQSNTTLRQVGEEELDILKERLACHLPHSLIVYGSVSLASHYGIHYLHPTSILVPADPRPSCLTITALISKGVQCIGVFWSPAEHTALDVARFLFHIPDLNRSQPVLLMGCASILQLSSLGIVGGQRLPVQVKFQGHICSLETPAIQDIKLPPQYYMSSLKEEDASVVCSHLKVNYFDTEDGIRHDIAHFPSVSIHKRSPTDSVESLQKEAGENLVSWIRTTKNGWMGNTFTQLQHRRKGLASKATLALAHQLLQKGLLAYVVIENNNTASMKFHDALGFKWQCDFCTLELLPVDKNI
ncbi:hypothetical protein O3P69_016654 [Scylla paramamosain]|uniref:GCN5-related N-acetyltransferase Rv2170-like domain-containing protein n=1 Tax=Scylla paramamosain TaxID=85552 RepID=A0AAW0SYY5_SCYPA